MLRRPRRLGFSLLEALVCLTILAILATAFGATVTRNQRSHRSITAALGLHAQMRYMSTLLQSELRGVSPLGGDIYQNKMLDSAIELRSTLGESIACVVSGSTLIVPPAGTLAAGHALSTWRAAPIAGDSVLILDEGTSMAAGDDRWVARAIAGVAAVTNGCAGSGFTTVGDASVASHALTLSAPLASTILPGAPLRLFRRVHYSLYRSSDQSWYLGTYDCSPARSPPCATIQPVAGALLPYANAAAGTSGLSLHYYDSAGVSTIDRLRVARIEVALRARSPHSGSMGGEGQRAIDSTRVHVGIRNRR